ncbi:hypothetical protein [Streptomyces bullii]|uniref:Uncharacterized protein n=1 Tax=Streptomyces bullii TaxID=349910 RepID=A0ABW0UM42_9ACTN
MSHRPTGPACGNNPNYRMSDGDRRAVADFKAYLAERAALRDRIRLAIARQFLDETGSGRSVDELDDAEFGTFADAVLAVLPAPVDRAAAPVKQRADLTEAEWAEQERARFERLCTRESSRADLAEARANNAARDVDIYRGRLERLGKGYDKQRQRADRAEAEAELLRTGHAALCICGHTEQQHFEDVCLACDCGDYLTPGAAREVIARWREAATRKPGAPVDRAAVLNEAADAPAAECSAQNRNYESGPRLCIRAAQHRGDHIDERGFHWSDTVAVYPLDDGTFRAGVNRAVLRRMAVEAQPVCEPCSRCGHGKAAHNISGCTECPGGWRAGHQFAAVEAQPTQPQQDETLAAALDGLHTLIATSSRDWGQYRVDAWIWAVLCGWDCEQTEHDDTCTHGALEEMQERHGWDDATVAKARRYRAAVRALVEAQQDGAQS